jgi:phosphotriesterase-related protein
MSQIMTVLGPITPEELGFTSMHEHILYDGRVFRRRFEFALPEDPPVKPEEKVCLETLGQLKHGFIQCWDAMIMEDEELMAAELGDFKAEGGSAVVDMSTPGLRVDPLKTRRVSEMSGVHIVAPTGLYSRDSWPDRFHNMALDDMESYMMQEVEEGIEGTDVKAGHVKVAIEGDFLEPEVDAMKAGARVAAQKGLSMTVHRGMLLGKDGGKRIADILESEKIDPAKVVLAHADGVFAERNLQNLIMNPESCVPKLETAREVLDRGYNISIDCFGHYWDAESLGISGTPDWVRMAGLVALIKEGYARQIVIGTDNFIKFLLRRFGGESYCRLTGFVVPVLAQMGIGEDDIHKITVENPARILAY